MCCCRISSAQPITRHNQPQSHRHRHRGGLPRLAGLQQAKRLALLAEMIDAAEAHRLGLVTWVVEPDEIDGFVADLGKRLAAGPPVALAQSKALLNEGVDRTMHWPVKPAPK